MIDLLVTYDTATSILMVINELLNNAWKYAFDKDHKGVVWIYVKEDIKTVYFTIEDNGKGMSEENKSSGIGYLIIDAIVKNDLKGNIHRNISRSGKGLSVTIDIPQTTFSPKKQD